MSESICEDCGQVLVGPVAAILHYDRMGSMSECEKRLGRIDRERRGRILAFDIVKTRRRARPGRARAGAGIHERGSSCEGGR